ncbi:hypothetical protein HPB48_009752 [Haemaphysalis longicornis]|uniref:Monocarboxylate transporter n=1 Tax=Haemaphysalis longicornis TaxID=44386 RepID=A0A9J6GRC4_HAELO|nr:hypothetical protein HPB48_009752 [Haemaphysalis longicornis]
METNKTFRGAFEQDRGSLNDEEQSQIYAKNAMWFLCTVHADRLSDICARLQHDAVVEVRRLALPRPTLGGGRGRLRCHELHFVDVSVLGCDVRGLPARLPHDAETGCLAAGSLQHRIVSHSFFDQHITTAMGILYMGPAIGSFIMIPLFGWCYKEYGLRGTFLIFSGITMHAIPFLLLMHNPAPTGREGRTDVEVKVDANCCQESTDSSLLESENLALSLVAKATHVFRRPIFYVITISNVAIGYCNTTVLSVIMDYAIDQGVPEVTAMAILNVVNVGDLVGRVGSGWITDRGIVSRSQMMLFEYVTLGVLVCSLAAACGVVPLMAMMFLYACTTGSTLVLFTNVIKDYLGSEWMPLASGWMMFFGGWTLLTGPSLVGYFRDNIGSYVPMFIFIGLSCFSCAAMWAIVAAQEYWTAVRRSKEQQTRDALGQVDVTLLCANGHFSTVEQLQSKPMATG